MTVPRAEKFDAVEILRKENELMRAAMAVAEEAAKAGTEALQVLEPPTDPLPADPDIAQQETLGSPPPAADPGAADDALAIDQATPHVADTPQACALKRHAVHGHRCAKAQYFWQSCVCVCVCRGGWILTAVFCCVLMVCTLFIIGALCALNYKNVRLQVKIRLAN